jgi:hypothetical protein
LRTVSPTDKLGLMLLIGLIAILLSLSFSEA